MEVWQMHKLTLVLIHTPKDQISETVVGIVVFASVSSRSLDRDPSWTPCGATTTPNATHQRLTSSFNGALFCWAWLEMTCFKELGSNSLHKNMRSCLSGISLGLPNCQVHQIQETWEVLFCTNKYICGLAVLHQLHAMAFWGQALKTSALILVQRQYSAGPGRKCERPRLLPLFRRHPKCKELGSACWHCRLSISSIHTVI